MSNEEIINCTIAFVKKELQGAEGGHDWWHIERVWTNAKLIALTERVNIFIVELAALLHDIADAKFYAGDETIGPRKAKEFLNSFPIDAEIINHVESIIRNISFKGGNFTNNFCSPELAVVQDADRLDAIGAIGIARAFNYGGYKNREIYNPAILPDLQMTKDEYKNSKAPTINHFYEKLLLLKEKMNTETGKKLAEERHHFMEIFLAQFYKEWAGKE
ncbi:HD domain-containing protein [Ginsengibacter hankyongi]|uniref:HD domain-containing protein n=1 Tax=Ginsengibacter hankyongi TaxID=2607284 RepID=A0A5J5IE52_9BACT|nr:HD domain-containing protein [Ginsengibacter hankyongi]KAA9037688.1 HD domain-containing protein [Ginsengibacter hankyongi]